MSRDLVNSPVNTRINMNDMETGHGLVPQGRSTGATSRSSLSSSDDSSTADPLSTNNPSNRPSLQREVTAVAVSSKDLEEEVRQSIIREAVHATVHERRKQPDHVSTSRQISRSPWHLAAFTLFLLFMVGGVLLALMAIRNGPDETSPTPAPTAAATTLAPITPPPSPQPSSRPTKSPTAAPTYSPERILSDFLSQHASFDNGAALRTPGTPQQSAFIFLLDHFADLQLDDRLIELYVLLTFFNAASGFRWSRSQNWYSLEEEEEASVCQWEGIACDDEPAEQQPPDQFRFTGGRVTSLSLPQNQLLGFLPPELGILTRLKMLDLSSNMLVGTIPSELAQLRELQVWNLAGNSLSGQVPSEVCLAAAGNVIIVDCASVECSCCTPQC